jgi:hypothetical protein
MVMVKGFDVRRFVPHCRICRPESPKDRKRGYLVFPNKYQLSNTSGKELRTQHTPALDESDVGKKKLGTK